MIILNVILIEILLYGILAGFAICTKQSIGITLAIVVVIYKLVFVENKEQFKEYIKLATFRIIGILIPVLILLMYLLVKDAIYDFMNYAILGISTFSNKIPYINLLENKKIEIKIFSIIMPISIILMAIILIITRIKKIENEKVKKTLTLLIYSFSIIIVMYPISDEIHFLIGSYISIIGLAYIIYLFCKWLYDKNSFNEKYKIYKIVRFVVMLDIFAILSVQSIKRIYDYMKIEKNLEINHFRNIEISPVLKDRINHIDNFILENEKEGKKVYILDADATIYMIPLDKYNKDYDMFLKGNIGKDGQEGQIERIANRKDNEIFLIRKEGIINNWQTPNDVLKYIRKNLENIGEIEIYDIYR